MVIMEVGSGKNVPTIRYYSKRIKGEIKNEIKRRAEKGLENFKSNDHSKVTLIRINPDFPNEDSFFDLRNDDPHQHLYSQHIPIQSRALYALTKINQAIEKLLDQK